MSRALTPKQERFCQEYLVDLNATQAAARAGYKNPEIGRQLIAKNNVSERIQSLMRDRELRTQVTVDRTLNELARLGFSDIRRIFDARGFLIPLHQIDDDMAAAISSIEVNVSYDQEGNETGRVKKIRLWSKTASLDLIGKHLNMFKEQVVQSGALTLRVVRDEGMA